jgi:integrase
MTGEQPSHRPDAYPGLLARLTATIRLEFRGDVLVFEPRDPVFGGPPCAVPDCGRPARENSLCLGHRHRWQKAGYPDLATFAATAGTHWQGHPVPQECDIPGCRFGHSDHGLCARHSGRWHQAGTPDLASWREAQAALPAQSPEPPACRVSGCGLWARSTSAFCHSHHDRWGHRGRPDPAEFDAICHDPRPGSGEHIDLRMLEPRLRLEVQYVLQCRRDEAKTKIVPVRFQPYIRALALAGVSSLLDEPEEYWQACLVPSFTGTGWRAFVLGAHRRIEILAVGSGWDVEYPRDVWRLRNLGIAGRTSRLRFAEIPQPWLKDLAKRWARWRLVTGLSAGWVGLGVRALARLGAFLAAPGVNVSQLAGIDRGLLERYFADLHAEFGGSTTQSHHVASLAGFLQAIRQHGWDSTLQPTAVVLPGDYPAPGQRLPRALPPPVLAQIEQPSSLDRWDNPAYRLITLILMRCGLRIGDAVKAPFDCVVTDDEGAPYLRYYNHKMKREALVPLDSETRDQIAAQQARVLGRWPDGTPALFPTPRANLDGRRPLSYGAYWQALRNWLQRCDIRDEHGRPVRVRPHQFRHSLGTTLINRDVPQHVVQKILDHDSPVMTAHYARLSDKTVREHWERARKVNAEGQPVRVSPDGPLGDAAWAKQRLSRATQALPNGYCQLPLAKTCPHANSCLTCPMFVTTAEFLPQHHAQRQATLQIITAAEAAGHARVAEMNRQVAGNLDKIIATLEDEGTDESEATAGAS